MARPKHYSDYDSFAWFYNRHWNREVPPQILTVMDRLLVPRLPAGGRVLDLCCGTGYTAGELTARGFEVTGLDGSAEMLRHARRNAPGAKLIHADARSFDLPPVYDGIISTFDSLNHLMTLEELQAALANVYRALVPGGFFLFDMNMEKAFLEYWAEYFAVVEEDDVCILRGRYDREARTGTYEITMFCRTEDQWRRSDALITERCYSSKQIKGALGRAGFREISTYNAERDMGLVDHAGRVFFLVRKGLETG
ncbi:MAG TPA: class I SAM-dependent methyltransferase [Pyrinomonadaceae bacterium]|jgi:SAM-dependent methyltransferase